MYNIFNALKLTDYKDIKAVILGQDPYHGFGQAHGLCFSVRANTPKPPSLINIHKELSSDLGIPIPKSGDLTPWAQNGVLLLNTVLTVREGQAGSHANRGWETFTDNIIRLIDAKQQPVCFLHWGRYAISKEQLIKNPIHHILKAPHPSPLSAHRGFFGCRHFSECNRLLDNEIDWRLA